MEKRAKWGVVLAISTIAALVAGVGTATATDSKFYSGTSCVAKTGAEQGDLVYTSGRAQNNHTTAARVVTCPVIRDDTVSNPSITDLEVWVEGRSGYQTSCTAYSRNRSATVQTSEIQYTELDGFRVLPFGADPDTSGDGSVHMSI